MKYHPDDTELRDVRMAGKYLAKQLRDALEDFGDMPARLAPAVMLQALMDAVPMVLAEKDSPGWPGSLRENREQMRRALLELLQTPD